ncbi:MAG: methylmalonyl-CoA mutase family protein [Bacteroidota bacterium]
MLSKTASDRQAWLDKLKAERKGADVSNLVWPIGPGLEVDPHPEPPANSKGPVRMSSGWEIGAYVSAAPPEEANMLALEELNGGVEALLFSLHDQPNEQEIGRMLRGIQPEFVSLHCNLFYPERDPAVLFRDLVFYLRSAGFNLAKVKGSVDFDPLLDWGEPPWQPLLRLLKFVDRYMPGFKVLQVNGKAFNTGPQYSATELSLIVAKGAEYLHQIQERGMSAELANRHLQFAVTQGTNYFVEIAKLRALRLLWSNVLEGFGIKDGQTTIAAHTDPEVFEEDKNQNLLRITSQGMSAVVGGADLVFLRPPDASPFNLDGTTDFGRRMARNVQQLLRLESGFEELNDPAAGSYFIDQLTDKLAREAWGKFLEIEQNGGFVEI